MEPNAQVQVVQRLFCVLFANALKRADGPIPFARCQRTNVAFLTSCGAAPAANGERENAEMQTN